MPADIITTNFAAEQTLTADTVPVNVDAVLFWLVVDVEKAALEVQNYAQAVSWASQTALRDIIGRTSLTDLLSGRERIEDDLQRLIDERTTPWGVTVQSVEMRDLDKFTTKDTKGEWTIHPNVFLCFLSFCVFCGESPAPNLHEPQTKD
jgi:regulator of protease activity HflC (stomatin/prohibitin superfamily)